MIMEHQLRMPSVAENHKKTESESSILHLERDATTCCLGVHALRPGARKEQRDGQNDRSEADDREIHFADFYCICRSVQDRTQGVMRVYVDICGVSFLQMSSFCGIKKQAG